MDKKQKQKMEVNELDVSWMSFRSQKSAALKSGAFRLMLVDESMAPSGRLTYHSNALCTSHFFNRCLHDHPRWFP